MTDDKIVEALRSEGNSASPLGMLNLLIRLKNSRLTQFDMIRYFKSAFPKIPLRILNEASTSRLLIGENGMTDKEFTDLLTPWFQPSA